MTERTIERTIQLKSAVDRVWKAITDPMELSRWFGDATELDLRPGGDGAFSWENHGRYAVRVEEVSAPNRIVWSWVHEPDVAFEDAPSTRVEWNLSAREDGGTTLYLKETGFLTDQHQGENIQGWQAELSDLIEYLQHGR
jgi:uncharacterized protein YndB with AHSA1/START domain